MFGEPISEDHFFSLNNVVQLYRPDLLDLDHLSVLANHMARKLEVLFIESAFIF